MFMMDDDNRVVRVIRSDVPDIPPYAGLVPFFMGTCHTHSLRARPDGAAVQILVLQQKAADELFENFPSELEVCSPPYEPEALNPKPLASMFVMHGVQRLGPPTGCGAAARGGGGGVC